MNPWMVITMIKEKIKLLYEAIKETEGSNANEVYEFVNQLLDAAPDYVANVIKCEFKVQVADFSDASQYRYAKETYLLRREIFLNSWKVIVSALNRICVKYNVKAIFEDEHKLDDYALQIVEEYFS